MVLCKFEISNVSLINILLTLKNPIIGLYIEDKNLETFQHSTIVYLQKEQEREGKKKKDKRIKEKEEQGTPLND